MKPSAQGSSCTSGIIQSAGVITAQSAQTPSVRHTWGPAIRSDTPNGYQGCRAAINYYSSTLAFPLLSLLVFFLPFFHLLYSHQQFYLRSISHLFSWASVSLSGTSQIVQSNGGFIHHQRAGGAGRKSGRRSIEMESHCLRVSQSRYAVCSGISQELLFLVFAHQKTWEHFKCVFFSFASNE